METLSKAKVKELLVGVPDKGTAEIRLLNPKRTGTLVIRDYKVNGQVRPFVDQFGNSRVQKIQSKVLVNFEKDDDRLLYEQVRLHPIYTKGARPVLTVVNHETEAEDFVLKENQKAKAGDIIRNLSKTESTNFAKVLLIPFANGTSESVIKRKLYEFAAEDPEKVINEWEDPSKELKTLLLQSIDKGLVTKIGGVYKFKGSVMGTSFELAVEWLRDNDDILPSIRKELK